MYDSPSVNYGEGPARLVRTQAPEWKRDNVPRIGGSFGGFVALVVCLSLLIIICCIAIFFLLRDQRTSDEEQARRAKRNRYATRSGSHSPSYELEGTSHRTPLTRLAAVFGRSNDPRRARPQNRSRGNMKGGSEHGWIQAGSTDDHDWNPDLGEGLAGPSRVRESASPSPVSLQNRQVPSPGPVSRSTSGSTTTSSVRFDFHAVRGLSYPERRPSPHSTLPNIHSQLSSPSYSPASSSPVLLRTLSPEPIPSALTLDDDSRQYVTPSGVVMRTLPGGSKFIEAL
ncbi:hypothetical protein LshimejAT787_0211240 [Lyophyllum shimeji]|uniref:Uncharacterized protein n=1 Tax=Lyophyllum shimeji TaxID=47721 RepID=A0A9P3UII4_LYOSH|nr:hypothetical protein LshimejAT787_0211240 [Lyophyllum shimeji]